MRILAYVVTSLIGLSLGVAWHHLKQRLRNPPRRRRSRLRVVDGLVVGPSDEITRLIRATGGRGPVSDLPREPSPPYDAVFRIENPVEFYLALDRRIGDRESHVGWSRLSRAEKNVHCAYWLAAEVNNGGFDQYFFNSAGDRASETLSALLALGASEVAAIFRRALAFFGEDGPSPVRQERWKQMDRWNPSAKAKLDDLDREFYGAPDVLDRVVAYARAHRDEFPA